MHTTFSDGILPPRELLQKAVESGLSAIAITDHDTIDGYLDAQNYIDEFDIELIIGCEFSCYDGGKEYHILGYAFDPDDSQIQRHFENFRKARLLRAKFIHKKLVNLGIDFGFDKILEKADKAPITRPHFAAVMHEMGHVDSLRQAFDLYIGDGGPAYYPKAVFPVANAISMINQAGGVAVLAHPGNYVDQSTLYKMIQHGLDGIEVYHPSHNDFTTKHYHSIASQYWLLETGGSDFHGNREYDEGNFGKITVPYNVVESINYLRHKK